MAHHSALQLYGAAALLYRLLAAYCPLVRLLPLLPGEEEVLKLPINLYSLLPEDILGGMKVKKRLLRR